MRNTLLLMMFLVLGLGRGSDAQTRPDFSGRWTTDALPAATPAPGQPPGTSPRGGGGPGRSGDMGSGWGSPITITQDGTTLTVEYAFFARGDMQPPLRFVYALDGSETKNSVMMGRGAQVQTSKVAWDGSKLIITTVHTFNQPPLGKPMATIVTQTLSLESPTSLVVDTTRTGLTNAPATSARTVYRKL